MRALLRTATLQFDLVAAIALRTITRRVARSCAYVLCDQLMDRVEGVRPSSVNSPVYDPTSTLSSYAGITLTPRKLAVVYAANLLGDIWICI